MRVVQLEAVDRLAAANGMQICQVGELCAEIVHSTEELRGGVSRRERWNLRDAANYQQCFDAEPRGESAGNARLCFFAMRVKCDILVFKSLNPVVVPKAPPFLH